MQQRWKTVESIARGAKAAAAFEWYGRRFGVHHGEDVLAVPVRTFVGGTPHVVWRADLDGSLDRLLDRLDGAEGRAAGSDDSSGVPPRGRLS
jgi:hypothetical protein